MVIKCKRYIILLKNQIKTVESSKHKTLADIKLHFKQNKEKNHKMN